MPSIPKVSKRPRATLVATSSSGSLTYSSSSGTCQSSSSPEESPSSAFRWGIWPRLAGGRTEYDTRPSSTRSRISLPAAMQSGLPPRTRPRCAAYCAHSSIGDQGTKPSSESCTIPSMSSLSTWVPTSWRSKTCCRVTGLRFKISFRGTKERSMTHLMAEKGSLTCEIGTSMPTIWASRGTSRRGKTTPGLSQRQVRSSSIRVCRVLVWPGVAFTLTTLPPIR
mmetsp:Transcript_6975/g.13147  ORF Transcript_6975/g.13147 Transcript_6975/m.13147 type:complete len:223 (+) Transcript_6975:396-1064(+)